MSETDNIKMEGQPVVEQAAEDKPHCMVLRTEGLLLMCARARLSVCLVLMVPAKQHRSI